MSHCWGATGTKIAFKGTGWQKNNASGNFSDNGIETLKIYGSPDRSFLHWFDIQQSRLLDQQYWFDKGDFFEAVWLDDDGHWKCGKKLTKGDAYKEMCMREAMNL
ncbi:MAG TPA: hypothetical protein VGI45_07350 [Terracidiphilus sp.]|jgi:hypothetical protein